MKAVIYERYGSSDVLQLKDIPKPVPKDNEVLIKVYATSVTATDATFRRGHPFFSRLYTGLIKPKRHILGSELSGEIETIGKDVTLFKEGDQVYGALPGHGAYVEYVCLPEQGSTLAIKPSNLSHEEAAAGCDGFLTALPFLRNTGKIQSGQKVLINGASGSVGSSAVQLAKHFGAEVTGVCSTSNVELVKSLGAVKVLDYTREDIAKSGETYDIIFDTVGKLSFPRYKRLLKQDGIFLEAAVGMGIFPHVLWTSLIGSKKAKVAATGLRPPEERTKDLIFLTELMEMGTIKSVIDKSYPLEQIAEAHKYVDTGHKKGNVAITM